MLERQGTKHFGWTRRTVLPAPLTAAVAMLALTSIGVTGCSDGETGLGTGTGTDAAQGAGDPSASGVPGVPANSGSPGVPANGGEQPLAGQGGAPPTPGVDVTGGGEPPTPAPAPTPTPAPAAGADDPFCGALSVMRTACQTCHGTELVGGAPMPLVTHDDMLAPAVSDPSKQVYELIGTRVHDDSRPMPPRSQTPLTDAELGAIDTWIAAGAPAPTGECTDIAEQPDPTAPAQIEWPEDCEERYEIRAQAPDGGPYHVPANAELNVDIEVPVPWAGQGRGPVQALAIRPISDNRRVVHHWILYAGTFEFITSWSPGKPFETFPEGVGVHMPSSGTFSLNMHYFNVGNDQAVDDRSGLEVCITRSPRPNTASTYMFAGSATVPPGQRVENASTCTVNASEPIHLITSSPHMHSYGVAAKLEVIRPDGSVEVLEDAPFNWEDQHVTPIDTVLNDGDEVRITCIYENNTGRTITFGSSSEDEMCFNFARYYPMDAFSCRGGGLGGFFGGF